MCESGRFVLLLVVYLAIAACGSDGGDAEPDGAGPDDEGPGGSQAEPSVPPIAFAGADQTVETGKIVTLDGSQSEATGALTYEWTLRRPGGSEASLNGPDFAMPRFIADVEGVYVATLVVTSDGVDSAPNSVRITAVSTRLSADAGKLHPAGDAIYTADNDLSPSDIQKHDISGGTAAYLYDSPYHGDFAMCGDLWISQDGLRIFTRCGNVFRSSPLQEDDMTYNGSLAGLSVIRHLDHATEPGKVAAIPDVGFLDDPDADTTVRIYDDVFLAFERSIELPSFLLGEAAYVGHGRNVFISADGTELFVVVQADGAPGLLNDFAIAT